MRTYSKNRDLVLKRRKQIVRKVTHLLTTKGFHNVSVREIAIACNMPVGTLYRYIGSKDDVLYLVINEYSSNVKLFLDRVHMRLKSTDEVEVLKWSFIEFCKHVREYRHLVGFSWREARNLKWQQRQQLLKGEAAVVDVFKQILLKGAGKGKFAVDSSNVLANDIVVLSELWALRYWFIKEDIIYEKFVDKQINLILNGILL